MGWLRARVRARVEAEAKRTVAAARSTHVRWQLALPMSPSGMTATNLLKRPGASARPVWRLADGAPAAIEARLAESQARLDANEAHYRLPLDAHALWSLDDDADHAH
ncbi:MAG: hypothetical protein IPP18_00165 [Rhodocyclaceae bacterium]|nr:hypothetical protein [Rhodocyclaceae bacterium]